MGGTRPEALKLAPVALAMRKTSLEPVVVSTGQHPEMFHQGLEAFGLRPKVELSVTRVSGSPAEAVSAMLRALDAELDKERPSAVVVQGDTSSALAGALTAFWRKVPVVHLEAGLRSRNLHSPFPEESNRQMISRIATVHLTPTDAARSSLLSEGIPSRDIELVGNTIIDALQLISKRDSSFSDTDLKQFIEKAPPDSRLMLVTVHRRESWGAPMGSVLKAVSELTKAHHDLRVVLPTHPNPMVTQFVKDNLARSDRILVTAALNYPDFVALLRNAHLVLTDSGGVQEEAPTFGTPILVLRDSTERQEGVDSGAATLVGTDTRRIMAAASRLLGSSRSSNKISVNPYGDGFASGRTVRRITELLDLPDTQDRFFRLA